MGLAPISKAHGDLFPYGLGVMLHPRKGAVTDDLIKEALPIVKIKEGHSKSINYYRKNNKPTGKINLIYKVIKEKDGSLIYKPIVKTIMVMQHSTGEGGFYLTLPSKNNNGNATTTTKTLNTKNFFTVKTIMVMQPI